MSTRVPQLSEVSSPFETTGRYARSLLVLNKRVASVETLTIASGRQVPSTNPCFKTPHFRGSWLNGRPGRDSEQKGRFLHLAPSEVEEDWHIGFNKALTMLK
jgi:hypothetical protein